MWRGNRNEKMYLVREVRYGIIFIRFEGWPLKGLKNQVKVAVTAGHVLPNASSLSNATSEAFLMIDVGHSHGIGSLDDSTCTANPKHTTLHIRKTVMAIFILGKHSIHVT